ncbi:MAG: hypothetical protein AB7V22_09385, partial [Kiritimatiellia bacterium]
MKNEEWRKISTVWNTFFHSEKKRGRRFAAWGHARSSAFFPGAEEADKFAAKGLAGLEFDGV